MRGVENRHSGMLTFSEEDSAFVISSGLTEQAGYRAPVSINRHLVWLSTPTAVEQEQGQTQEGRLKDILMLSRVAIERQSFQENKEVSFDIFIGKELHSLTVACDTKGNFRIFEKVKETSISGESR